VAADLRWLQARGLADRILAYARSGGRLIGICGGYQLLGRELRDPLGIESDEPMVPGLGLLEVNTEFAGEKTLTCARGVSLVPNCVGYPVFGYEIHHGRTTLGPGMRPAVQLDSSGPAGAATPDGQIFGCYLHGLFDSAPFRRALLTSLGWTAGPTVPEPSVFDRLADWIEKSVDTRRVRELIDASPSLP
jgi:adenosylcobyric acid synthase